MTLTDPTFYRRIMSEKYIKALLRELAYRTNADTEAIKAELQRLGYQGPEIKGKGAPKETAVDTTPKETATN